MGTGAKEMSEDFETAEVFFLKEKLSCLIDDLTNFEIGSCRLGMKLVHTKAFNSRLAVLWLVFHASRFLYIGIEN